MRFASHGPRASAGKLKSNPVFCAEGGKVGEHSDPVKRKDAAYREEKRSQRLKSEGGGGGVLKRKC